MTSSLLDIDAGRLRDVQFLISPRSASSMVGIGF
jgi:hypothetical protein